MVLVVGYLSVDTVCSPSGTHQAPGGAALYAALGARWAGSPAAIAAAVGADYPSHWLEAMKACGIGCDAIQRRPGPTRRARLAHDASGARRSHHDGAWWERTAALAPDLPSLAGVGCVVACPMPAHQLRRVLDWAKGVPVVADTSEAFAARNPAALLDLLPRLHAFAPSREETRLLMPGLGDDEAALALASQGVSVMQKRGADGAVCVSPGQGLVRLPAPTVPRIVDPTGAGDAVVGALAALLTRLPFLEAARLALGAGALAVSGVGPAAFGMAGGPVEPAPA